MSRLSASALVLSATLAAAAGAAPLEGSGTIICAPLELQSCSEDAHCDAIRAEEIDAPRFLTVSLEDKTVVGTRPSGQPINAKIDNARRIGGTIYLQGVQETFGWSMAIAEADGKMSLMVSDSENGVAMFGACTRP